MLHPFYVKTEDGGDWGATSNLTKGDEVLTEDGRVVYVENVQVEKLDKKIKVYNLEIEDLHTYFLAGGVLVHNVCDEVISGKKHYLHRPYIRRSTKDGVNANTLVDYKTGQIYDSITKMWVDPENVELGHKKKFEFCVREIGLKL